MENACKSDKKGIDEASVEMIIKVWPVIPWWMKEMYDACLREEYFPND